MVETKAGSKNVIATFRLPRIEGVESATVVGEFNDWSETANPMDLDDAGFSTKIPLTPGRTYRFRYLLDGERWENDWNADAYVPNEFGGDDSVIDLRDTTLAAAKPRKAAAKTTKTPRATKTTKSN